MFLSRKGAKLPGNNSAKATALFHLKEDPAEEHDLSDKHPEKVKQMRTLAEKRLADISRNMIPLGK